MRLQLVLLVLSLFAVGVLSCTGVPDPQTTPLPLADFRRTSGSNSGNWQLENANTVRQIDNSRPTAFVGPQDGSLGQVVKGTIQVATTNDDDFIGFVFGLDCTPAPPSIISSCSGGGILFDWKQGDQNGAIRGTVVSRFSDWNTADDSDFWDKSNTVSILARGNNFGTTGWIDNESYDFVSVYTRTNLQVYIDGVLEFDVSGTFPLGRNGFYGNSQDNTLYSDIQIVQATGTHLCAAAPVAYTFDFNHSGGCTAGDLTLMVIWDVDDPSEGMGTFTPTTLGASTGTFEISNVYINPGAHIFRMQLISGVTPQGLPVDEFALVRDPVDVSIQKTAMANCGVDTRCDADTAILSFLTSAGGTPAYTALWTDGDSTCCAGGTCSACDSTRTVGAGTYGVTLMDAEGCTDTSNVVSVTTSVVSSLTFSEATCGNLSTFVSGGCGAISYAWSTVDGCSSCITPGATSQSGLAPGTYSLTVTDTNGCTRSSSYSTNYSFSSPAVEDELIYMYIPFDFRWSGFQAGTVGNVFIEHTVNGQRVTLFSGDVSSTTEVNYSIHMFEPGYVNLRFEGTGASSCFVERRFYLCASNHTTDPMCDEI